ncbi:predicted protein [Nematostella vectensis]|uniref:Uncharacterized protein n=2 Tax=Nematostella vectensis TaxID=45351 RepID=A7S2U5_NEMVE|nr:probable S-adenosylmethionine-dependent methyltransferase At5g38100 isoform X2 [Nematostella vectensis]EDO41987.1 predicted protein [Nematostella vectensis]|eukprot:XP_001634050.1 predicted protein [Nematostella vectensis]
METEREVINEAIPLAVQAALSSAHDGGVFTIVDYGCADGGTSMSLMYAIVKALRERYGDSLPIHVIYEDQPVNDFKGLFMRMQGLIPGPPSYLLDFKNVFVTTCGTSFYSQCLPDNSVTFGFSSSCMHWLRDKPCDITGALCHIMGTDVKEKEAFARQAAKDWETILLHRAAELKSGSKMVLVQNVLEDQEQSLANTSNMKESFLETLTTLWQGLVTDGTITQDEFLKTNFNLYCRTIKEYRKPFEDPESPVRKAGLNLVSMETKFVPCSSRQKWIRIGDPTEHARRFASATRVWSDSSFKAGLSDKRTCKEKEAIVDELFRRYEREVEKNPENHFADLVHCHMLIEMSE